MSKELPIDKIELNCLKQALWHESRGEGREGIIAVANVIMNRVNSPRYPSTYCGVIHQRWQFSFVDERRIQGKPLDIKPSPVEKEVLSFIDEVAHEVLTGTFIPVFGPQVMWYHATHVRPHWSKVKQREARINRHIFYRG